MYPYSHLGRAVAVCCAITGICVIALIVNGVQVFLKLDVHEELAMEMLRSVSLHKRRKDLAANVVQHFLRFAAHQLKGSERYMYLKALSTARFLWPKTGQEVAVGWMPWRKLSPLSKLQLEKHKLKPVEKKFRAPLTRALEAWRSVQKEWELHGRRKGRLEVVDDKVQAVWGMLSDLTHSFKEALPELRAHHQVQAEQERASVLKSRVAREQYQLGTLIEKLPGLDSEERSRLQSEVAAVIARGASGLPHGFQEREERAKLAAAAAKNALETLMRSHYNPMLSARALAAHPLP